jgi:serine/threonine protein kinase
LEGIGEAVVRRYLHGGALARWTGDLFPGGRRPLREIEASEKIRRKGVATPEILAVYSRRFLPGLRRACVLTRLVPEAENLRQWLGGAGRQEAQWGPMLGRVARAVRFLHEAGCRHRDLNLGNLLVSPTGIWVLDLDGAVVKDEMEIRERGANLMRLYRSLCKETGRKRPLSPRQRLDFLRHYAHGNRRLFRELFLHLKVRWGRERLRRAFSRRRSINP